MTAEINDRITRLEVDQSYHRDDVSSLRMSIESLRKMNWRHISISVSAIVFTAIVLIGAGQMYFSLVGVIHGVEDKLETKIVAFEDRMSDVESRISDVESRMFAVESRMFAVEERMFAVEERMSSLEDQMVKGFENLISLIEGIPLNSKSKKLSALTEN